MSRATKILSILGTLSLALFFVFNRPGQNEQLYRSNAAKTHERSGLLFDRAHGSVSDQVAVLDLLRQAESAAMESKHWATMEQLELSDRHARSKLLLIAGAALILLALVLSLRARPNAQAVRITSIKA